MIRSYKGDKEGEEELDLTFSVFLIPTLLLSLTYPDVSFPSRHHDSVWLDCPRGCSTTIWSVRVLVILGDFAIPRGLLQKFPFLNHHRIFTLIPDVMGTAVIALPPIIVILVLPQLPLLVPFPLMVMTAVLRKVLVRVSMGFFPHFPCSCVPMRALPG